MGIEYNQPYPPLQLAKPPAPLQMQAIDFDALAWELVRTQGVDPIATQQKLAQIFRAIARTSDVAWLPKLHVLFMYMDRLVHEQRPPTGKEMHDLGFAGVQAEFADMHNVLKRAAELLEDDQAPIIAKQELVLRIRRQFQIL